VKVLALKGQATLSFALTALSDSRFFATLRFPMKYIKRPYGDGVKGRSRAVQAAGAPSGHTA
jgi:hypothetical protein